MKRLIMAALVIGLFSLSGQILAQGTATIQGYVYNDLNSNMVRDAGEYGFFGVFIVAGVDSTYTDLDGFYQLTVPAPGSYDVIERPSGGESTTPDTVAVTVVPGGVYLVDFGDFLGLATIYGHVFNDLNGNGTWEQPGEPPLPGVTIYVDGDSTTTNVDGLYFFLVDAPGVYAVEERDPAGYYSTTPNEVHISVEPETSYRIDFGDAERSDPTATIYGMVFNDVNGDGLKDDDETGIPGVTVNVDGDNTTTDLLGEYSHTITVLSGLAPRTVIVTETDPAGYHSTTPNEIHIEVEAGGSYPVNFGDAETSQAGSSVDIKPGSCPNPFNTRSKGKLPVAVLGTGSFDVRDIDPSTVLLEGVTPLKHAYEDVAMPATNGEPCECSGDGPDGYTDLVLHFSRQALVTAMGPVIDGEMRELTLTFLTYAGSELEGGDCVLIKHKPSGPALPQPEIEIGQAGGPDKEIVMTLGEASEVSMVVYDVQGRRIRVLADRVLSEGEHSFRWDGTDEAGCAVVGGVYFCRIKAGRVAESAKILS